MGKKNTYDDIQQELARVSANSDVLNVESYLATADSMPALADIVVYNYEKDMEDARKEGESIVRNLANMVLSDNPAVLEHPYIEQKIQEDASVYSDTKIARLVAMRNLLSQQQQIDAGERTKSMYDTANQTLDQLMRLAKFAETQRTRIEKDYYQLRKDLGLGSVSEKMEKETAEADTETKDSQKSTIMDSRALNEMAQKLMETMGKKHQNTK